MDNHVIAGLTLAQPVLLYRLIWPREEKELITPATVSQLYDTKISTVASPHFLASEIQRRYSEYRRKFKTAAVKPKKLFLFSSQDGNDISTAITRFSISGNQTILMLIQSDVNSRHRSKWRLPNRKGLDTTSSYILIQQYIRLYGT